MVFDILQNYCSISFYFVQLPILGLILYFLIDYVSKWQEQKKLDRWANTPHNVVILHGFPPGKTVPNNSPFVLKLETYLRMAKISYKHDFIDFFGPKGKTPWITLNGEHVADSQLIIEFLQKKFRPKLNSSYSDSELAISTSFRIMLEEHFFWGLALERFVYNGREFSKKVENWKIGNNQTSRPWWFTSLYRYAAIPFVKHQAYNHGLGRHSKQDILNLTINDLKMVSNFLGNKKFIVGVEPCINDCGIFGQLAQAVWALPNSEYEKLVKGELNNLEAYCKRMKERFYPDWNSCLG